MTFQQEIRMLIFLVLALAILLITQQPQPSKQETDYIAEYRLDRDMNDLQNIIDNTTAEGVIVYDPATDTVLGSKNIEKTYSLASLTKIVTATIAYEKDKTLLNEIREMMKTSNNEEAQKIAYAFGPDENAQAEYMNNFTKRFGEFTFRNVSGLDITISTTTDERISGAEAKPMALVGFIKEYYLKYPEIFDQTIVPKGNTNLIADNLSFLAGGKTGFTLLAGGNLFVSVQKGLDRQIFIIVLNSTEKNRFVDVQNIARFLVQSSI